jgi:hypothetical protein
MSKTGQLLVIATYVVPKAPGGLTYEMLLATDPAADAPRMTVRTANVALYQRALEIEGTSRRAVATYHRDDAAQRLVLDALEVI